MLIVMITIYITWAVILCQEKMRIFNRNNYNILQHISGIELEKNNFMIFD